MKREILFKGRFVLDSQIEPAGLQDGDWIKGSLWTLSDGSKKIFHKKWGWRKVNPETVCQYTGKLGSDFSGYDDGCFKGDVITVHEFDCFDNDLETTGTVDYRNGAFYLVDITKTNHWNEWDAIPLCMMNIHEESITVHGNIHDKD